MLLLLLFIGIPLLEITLFIQIGGAIGLGWTLVTVIITALWGLGWSAHRAHRRC